MRGSSFENSTAAISSSSLSRPANTRDLCELIRWWTRNVTSVTLKISTLIVDQLMSSLNPSKPHLSSRTLGIAANQSAWRRNMRFLHSARSHELQQEHHRSLHSPTPSDRAAVSVISSTVLSNERQKSIHKGLMCPSKTSNECQVEPRDNAMSASLIGRFGSSAFRLSTVQCRCRSRARASLRNRRQGPSIMGFENEVEQSIGRPCRRTDGRSSGHANSPHPSSREGHHATAWWSSRFLLSGLILHCHAAAASCRLQRNSVPSTQMRCMMTAKPTRQRDDGLLHAAAPGDLHRPGLEPGPFC